MEDRHITLGSAADAHKWVTGSSLPQSTQAPLLRFIHRFPTLAFYRQDAVKLDALEETKGVTFPRWLREIRQTLAFVMPGYFVSVRFDECLNPYLDHLGNLWYTLGLRGYANNEDRDLLESVGDIRPVPIGEEMDSGISTLAINLADTDDQRVYEFTLEDLYDNRSDGKPLNKSIFEMFDSYAAMLGHVVAIKLEQSDSEDAEVIEAQD